MKDYTTYGGSDLYLFEEGGSQMGYKIYTGEYINTKDFVFDLIKEEGVVYVHGSGFCQEFGTGHFRTVLLAPIEVLDEAFSKTEKFIRRHVA